MSVITSFQKFWFFQKRSPLDIILGSCLPLLCNLTAFWGDGVQFNIWYSLDSIGLFLGLYCVKDGRLVINWGQEPVHWWRLQLWFHLLWQISLWWVECSCIFSEVVRLSRRQEAKGDLIFLALNADMIVRELKVRGWFNRWARVFLIFLQGKLARESKIVVVCSVLKISQDWWRNRLQWLVWILLASLSGVFPVNSDHVCNPHIALGGLCLCLNFNLIPLLTSSLLLGSRFGSCYFPN